MATTRKPIAPVTNPRASQNQAGRASTPVQTKAVVDQAALRVNPRSAEVVKQQQNVQHAQALTQQNNTAAIQQANRDLKNYQDQLALAIPGSSQHDALSRQVAGKANQIGILESGTFGTTTTAGGQRALADMQAQAGQDFTQDPLYRTGTPGAGGQAGALGFNPAGSQSLDGAAIERANASADQIEAQYKSMGVYDPALIEEAKGKARTAVLNEETARLNNQAAQSVITNQNAAQSAASAAAGQINQTTAPGTTMTERSDMRGMNRQQFVQEQRKMGKSDPEIQQMINTLPPEQTGGVQTSQKSPTNAPQSTGTTAVGTTTAGTPTSTVAPVNPVIEQGVQRGKQNTASLVAALAANEPPEVQAIVQAILDEAALYDTEDPISRAQFGRSADASEIASPYDAIAKIVQGAETSARAAESLTKNFLAEQYDRNEKNLAAREESTKQQLQFAEDESVRVQAENNRKMLDSETIRLALLGGFGSVDGNREVDDARYKGEEAISNLRKEFGFKRTDLSLNFTQMYNEAYDTYKQDWLTANENLQTRLADLSIQGITNQQAKGKEIKSAYTDYLKEIKDSKTKQAEKITAATKVVYDVMKQEREGKADTDRQQQKDAFDQMKWYKSTFGSNPPKGVVESLQKNLPDIDVASFFATKTAAETKVKAGSSAGSSSFTPRERMPDGRAMAFEDYLQQKRAQDAAYSDPNAALANEEARLGYTMNESERAAFISNYKMSHNDTAYIDRVKAEYNAKRAEEDKYSPSVIQNLLDERTSGSSIPKHTRENAQSVVNGYIKSGDYQRAYDFVDGLGSQPTQTERTQLSKARTAKNQVQQILKKFETLDSGPVVGRIRELNPYDTEIVEIDAMITQTIPTLARGIFGEVGVLTDQDIKTYRSTIANPLLTQEQAILLTNNLLKTIDYNTQSQLAVMRNSGISTSGLEELFFGSGAIDVEGRANQSELDSAIDSYLYNQ